MPVVVVLPGLIAVALEGTTIPSLEGDRSRAYPSMLSLLPNGILGLTFAALRAFPPRGGPRLGRAGGSNGSREAHSRTTVTSNSPPNYDN